ncbi:ABC-2 type transport system permease protein [Peptoclostridium litorale DSM 5388]|uniref:Transport permease protein n=1 Tax=Peptoclostridium litorale DSM 5388 TaxID=1121324 RepID=A0A069RFX8_PEPLI|nr:ABC transporter permease [Peptoclostridium litorale]KDR95698.1 ABC transporter permease protein [Peptoclostridium litorale DSM 5388]SIO01364.1 ABC-2 type transport system permease protein [Peptoclostridium litorale DSM 5388]
MRMKFRRLLAIIKKEFIHIKRDPPSLIMAVMMPIIFIFLFGYAVNTDVDNIKMAVLDMDKSTESRELVSKFKASNYFIPSVYVKNRGEIETLIDRGDVKSALVIPSGFSKTVRGFGNSSIQLIIDGVDPTTARTALQSGFLLSTNYSLQISSPNGNGISPLMGAGNLDVRTKVWYNPNLESSKFTIPGLIGLIMQNITVMLTAFSLVREKEKGTMELLMVTPIRPVELIVGKMVPYIFIGTIDFLIALSFGTYWFDVPIQGSLILLVLLGIIFVMCSLAIGMLISTVAQTQAQAMQMAMLFILPSVLLSGFVFPRESMPVPIQLAGYVIPLTYFLRILRGIILKGSGLTILLHDVAVLLLFGILLLAAASMGFKKKLD